MPKLMIGTAIILLTIGCWKASATTVTVRIPEQALEDGRHTINLNLVVDKPTTPPPVTPPPTKPPAGCVAGRYVQIIQPPAGSYERTFWNVAPRTTYAFKFKTSTSNKPVARRFSAARVSGSDRGKLLVISRCAGGSPVMKTCQSYSAEASTVSAYTNIDPKQYPRVCILQPNTTYYANVVSKYRPTDTKYNCGEAPATPTRKCAFLYNQR